MIELAKADRYAASIIEALQPMAKRLSIAGSIRRRKPFVGDIDIVVIPHAGQDRELRERAKQNAIRIVRDGSDILTIWLKGEIQVEFYFACDESNDMFSRFPSNWGSVLLCRTGSTEHNIYLVERAKQLGKQWNPHHGVFANDKLVASATEMDIFTALELDFVPPEKRER